MSLYRKCSVTHRFIVFKRISTKTAAKALQFRGSLELKILKKPGTLNIAAEADQVQIRLSFAQQLLNSLFWQTMHQVH